MSDTLAATIAQATNPGATLRTGTVTRLDGTTLTVNIGGGQLGGIPYLRGYLPILGDTVQILQQGPLNVILDAVDSIGDGNYVANGSFEADPPGSTVTGWTAVQTTTTDNVITVGTAIDWGPKDGLQWLKVAHGVTAGLATVNIASNPFPVNPGELWSAVAWTVTGGVAAQPNVFLKLALFADPATAYPGFAVEPVVQRITGPTGPRWTALRAIAGPGILIPDGITAARLVLAVQFTDGNVWFDQATARLLPQ
jgi:hypothetical protein